VDESNLTKIQTPLEQINYVFEVKMNYQHTNICDTVKISRSGIICFDE